MAMKKSGAESFKNTISVIIMVIAALWVLFPFYWAAITSLKLPVDVFRLAFIPWLQFKPTTVNWQAEIGSRGGTIFPAWPTAS